MPYQICGWVPRLTKKAHFAPYEVGDWSYGPDDFPRVITWGEDCTLKIGKYCSFAEGTVLFLGGEHRYEWVTSYPISAFFPFAADNEHKYRKTKGDIIIGNDVWLGHEAFVLSGVRIGDGAVVGARAVVAKDVKPYSIVVGNPARHIKYRFPEDICAELLKIKWWDWPLEKVEESLPLMLSTDVRGFVDKYRVSA